MSSKEEEREIPLPFVKMLPTGGSNAEKFSVDGS
jgi:hypothetical protein